MKQPMLHTPPLHSWPLPHEEPSPIGVHAEVDFAGWQI
jgi:hypothetical protein